MHNYRDPKEYLVPVLVKVYIEQGPDFVVNALAPDGALCQLGAFCAAGTVEVVEYIRHDELKFLAHKNNVPAIRALCRFNGWEVEINHGQD